MFSGKYRLYSLSVIGDREGDRLISNLSPLESTMDKGIQKIGDRLIEKMMFFSSGTVSGYNLISQKGKSDILQIKEYLDLRSYFVAGSYDGWYCWLFPSHDRLF